MHTSGVLGNLFMCMLVLWEVREVEVVSLADVSMVCLQACYRGILFIVATYSTVGIYITGG